MPTSHADLIPTLLGLAGIDQAAALAGSRTDHTEADRSSAATSPA